MLKRGGGRKGISMRRRAKFVSKRLLRDPGHCHRPREVAYGGLWRLRSSFGLPVGLAEVEAGIVGRIGGEKVRSFSGG